MAKRKTYTSAAVKNRWNTQHYDRIIVHVPAGAKAEVQKLADDMGLSVAEYIRQAIRIKAARDGKSDEIPTLRGGGLISHEKYLSILNDFKTKA